MVVRPIPRLATLGTCLIAVTLGVAGCKTGASGSHSSAEHSSGDRSHAASAAPSGSPDAVGAGGPAADQLSAAVSRLREQPFRYTVTTTVSGQVVTLDGAADPRSQVSSVTVDAGSRTGLTMEIRTFGTEVYLKTGGLSVIGGIFGGAGTWIHLDAARLKNIGGLSLGSITDPSAAMAARDAFVTVERTGDRTFRGTLDLTKATAVPGGGAAMKQAYGEAARSVPFEATLDGDQRVSSVKVSMPAGKAVAAFTIDARYSDFGASVSVERPPADQITEAPDAIYNEVGA